MTFMLCDICQKMSFYDVYDEYREFQKYGNKGIKLTVPIAVLQKIEKKLIFTHGGIEKWSYLFSKMLAFVFPFKQWELFGGPLNLIESKNH